MKIYESETLWLNEESVCSLEELVETSGLSLEELQELINCGAMIPINQNEKPYVFQLHYIIIARKAKRLRDDFELDMQGLAVALNLLRKIHALELELELRKKST